MNVDDKRTLARQQPWGAGFVAGFAADAVTTPASARAATVTRTRYPARTTTRPAFDLATCGAARTPRCFPRSRPRCIGGSLCSTICDGWNAGGLTYYGCCEPLHQKIDLLRKIPNLRKLSVSPRCNSQRVVREVGTDYVLSRKPNPAILAEDDWQPQRARQEIVEFLEIARGCHVELIMKDISTVRYQPQRLWEWAAIAMEVAEEFAA
jgi:hypothetical protein